MTDNQNFTTVVTKLLRHQARQTVIAIIDEQPQMLADEMQNSGFSRQDRFARRSFQQRWQLVTLYQLKILALAAQNAECQFCEIRFAGASTEQVRAILSTVAPNRRTEIVKGNSNANALREDAMQGYVGNSGKNWVVMGYHVNACVAATCGVAPSMPEDRGTADLSMTPDFGLLQFGKTIYTSDVMLHPAAPDPIRWSQLDDYDRLFFSFDPLLRAG